MSGHGVMMSIVSYLSYLSYLGEFICFLGCFFFCIAGSINGVYGYLEAIYSCPAVKVMPGHASMGRFRSPYRPLFFLTLQLSWASGTLFRAKNKNKNARFGTSGYELTIKVPPYVKPTRGHPRSSEVTDLREPKMFKFVPGIEYRVFWCLLA